MKSNLGFLTGILLLAGCSTTEPSRLRIAMTVDKTVVAVDDSVRVSLNLTNVSPRTVTVLAADAYDACRDAFEVYDANGRPALMHVYCVWVAAIAPALVSLAPGESLAIDDWWHLAWTRFGEEPITPGTYQIRGRAESEGRTVHTDLRQIIVTD